MIALGLLLGALIPLFAGLPWALALRPARNAGDWPLALAYGYVLGLLAVVLGMRLLGLAHLPIGLPTSAALPVIVGALGWWRTRAAAAAARTSLVASLACWRSLPPLERALLAGSIALIVLRLLNLAGELLPRPLFPWDAVSAVATKARAWYEAGALVPFVSPAAWLEGAGVHTDVDPSGFALPSLLLVWGAACMGQWHEGGVGFAWWMLGVASTLALYGHVRQRAGPFLALAAAYVFISLPIVDLNIALAGAPPWIGAAGVGLAACAATQWIMSPSRTWLAYAAIGAVLAAASQMAAWPSLAVIAVAVTIRAWPRAARKIAVIVPLAVVVALLALQQTPVAVGHQRLQVGVAADWMEALQSLLLLDNWHLLFLLALVAIVAARRLIFTPEWLPATWMVAMGLGAMVVAGTLAMPGIWYGGLRDMSPFGMQWAPALVLWIAVAAQSHARRAAAATTT